MQEGQLGGAGCVGGSHLICSMFRGLVFAAAVVATAFAAEIDWTIVENVLQNGVNSKITPGLVAGGALVCGPRVLRCDWGFSLAKHGVLHWPACRTTPHGAQRAPCVDGNRTSL